MKFLIGIISGITLAGAGIAVTSGSPSSAEAERVSPQVGLTSQIAIDRTRPASKQMRLFAGELSRKDGGFELKLKTLQNGETVEREVRVLVANARITNGAGTAVRLPLEDADARVSASMLPRSAWRLDDEGRLVPTLAAKRIVVTAATGSDQTTGDAAENTQETTEVHDSDAD
jgi:hypothetical protein